MNFMVHSSAGSRFKHQRGAALIIVLAFIVMLLVLLLAFFSRATLQEQISKSSSSFTVADVFAEGATESIIGDLRQEIVAGSVATNFTNNANGVYVTNTVYYPITNTTFEPVVSGFVTNADVLNLVKISSSTNFFPTGVQIYTNNQSTNQVINRATADSTTNRSLNGRYISPARWNQPLFITLTTNGAGLDTTPAVDFTPPNWILVARDGSNPGTNAGSNAFSTNMVWSPTNTSAVVGRYAYAIYNEGGVLDANVAGYPINTNGTLPGGTTSNTAYSSAEAFATLSELGMTTNQISALVGWRNFASSSNSGSYPSYTFTSVTNYAQMVRGNTNGFMRVATNVTSAGISDRMFSSRQQLISFMEGADPANVRLGMAVMQNLSTHTRDLNQPSYAPASNRPTVLNTNLGGNNTFTNGSSTANTIAQDNLINPSFLSIRVTNSFTRSDGSTAVVGEPLVKKRFALNRIAWLTYKGPSATLYQTTPNDPEIQALLSNGITAAFLQQGNTTNIQTYFGLTYNTSAHTWTYGHNGTNTGSGPIMRLTDIAALPTRILSNHGDPDFFEMLKASIAVGSLGKAAVNSSSVVPPLKATTNGFDIYTPPTYSTAQVPANYRYKLDSSVDNQVIQIGANIINQFHADSFPRRIIFNSGSGIKEFDGVTDLPYLSYIYNGVLRTSASQAAIIQVPAVWNVYDPNGTRPPSTLYPQKFEALINCNDPISLATNIPDLTFSAWSSGVDSTNGVHFSYNSAPLSPGHSDVIQFWPGANNLVAFREPTWLVRANSSAGSSSVNVTHPNGGNISCIDSNVIAGANDKPGASYSPLILGTISLAFPYTNTSTKPPTVTQISATTGYIGPGTTTTDNRVYFTYRLQYLDPISGTYITYDTKYGRVSGGIFHFNNNGIYSPSIGGWSDNAKNWTWGASIDPRSARFGLFTGGTGGILAQNEFATAPSVPLLGESLVVWIDITNGISLPLRPDQASGHYVWDPDTNDPTVVGTNITQPTYLAADVPMTDVPYPSNSAGWGQIKTIMEGPQYVPGFSLGIYSQNNVSVPYYSGRFTPEPTAGNFSTNQPGFYADPDGVVRRAADAYVGIGSLTNSSSAVIPCSASNPVGQPEAAYIDSPPYQDAYTNPANVANFPSIGIGYPPPVSTNQIVPYTASPFSQSQSHPLFLHRPFRSVAELGYVFRDLPWKNLDFFTPESGDTALLDTFCINDTSNPNNLVAGRLDLNTRKTNVISALIMGSYIDDPKVTNMTVGTVSRTLSTNVAVAFINYTATNSSANTATNTGPLMNLAQLVGHYATNVPVPKVQGWTNSTNLFLDGKSSYVGFSGVFTNNYGNSSASAADLVTAYYQALSTNSQYLMSMVNIQRFHEAPIRALSAAGQERVWNLMIDVIAQTGRYPASASKLQNFVVEGEQRYWVHLSIDRLTGQVIDKQIEVVK